MGLITNRNNYYLQSNIYNIDDDIGWETYDVSFGGVAVVEANEGVCGDGDGVVVIQEDDVDLREPKVSAWREEIVAPEMGRGMRNKVLNIKLKEFVTHTIRKVKSSESSYAQENASGKEPKNFKEVVKVSGWCDVMRNEIQALEDNETWVMEKVSFGKNALGREKYKSAC
ncbi:hypothetical protein KIW84_024142 [Lathyrus oleraceus]|uniref:Uncharacterized protein n=1 Tax=Pisum sativum TaxID=3888 RepID=A0A9D4YEU7_PEA|nr:hypothetical protein KIW84_024142 [Pisum sativum]